MKLRIKFTKHGVIRFIGHLDLMRFFQKAIRRAEIDVSYTTGFSPHQIMSFAVPLGVGLTSNGEYMDIQVDSFTSCEDVKNRLNHASIPEIQVVNVRILPDDAENAMASVAAALYSVSFKESIHPELDYPELISRLLAKDEIPYVKETKKGARTLDLRPGIYELTFEDGYFHVLVDASSAGNIKPQFVIKELLQLAGITLPDNALKIVREEVYANIGTQEERKLVPLEDLGHE